MNKLFSLIVDDVKADSEIIRSVIDRSVLNDHYTFDVCGCVESIPNQFKNLPGTKVALDFIRTRAKRNQSIDFAFLDMMFIHEFDGTEGVDKMIEELQNLFPLCRIIVISKDQSKYPNTMYFCNGQGYPTISKDTLPVHGPSIIDNQLKIWTKIKLSEISADQNALELLSKTLNDEKFSLESAIKINNENWMIADLFMFHIGKGHNTASKISSQIAGDLFEFPKFEDRIKTIVRNGKEVKVTSSRWHDGDTIFKLPIKDYYYDLYIFKNSELKEILQRSLSLFESFVILYLNAILDNNLAGSFADLRKERGTINLVAKLDQTRTNGMIPFSEMEKFKEKLIARNAVIASYIILQMTVKSIVFLLTEHDHYLSGNDSKHLSSFLFLLGLENEKMVTAIDKRIGQFEAKPENGRVTELPPSKREYESIYKNISGKEREFLKLAYDKFHEILKSGAWSVEEKERLDFYFEENEAWLKKIKLIK